MSLVIDLIDLVAKHKSGELRCPATALILVKREKNVSIFFRNHCWEYTTDSSKCSYSLTPEVQHVSYIMTDCKADQHLCICYTDCTIPVLSKCKISSFYPSSVTVQLGLCRIWWEPKLLVFSCTGSNIQNTCVGHAKISKLSVS